MFLGGKKHSILTYATGLNSVFNKVPLTTNERQQQSWRQDCWLTAFSLVHPTQPTHWPPKNTKQRLGVVLVPKTGIIKATPCPVVVITKSHRPQRNDTNKNHGQVTQMAHSRGDGQGTFEIEFFWILRFDPEPSFERSSFVWLAPG